MNNIGNPDLVSPLVASVAVIDNDRALCELLRDRLNDEAGLACAGVATTPDEARALVVRHRPSVVIVDVGLGQGVDAIDLVAELVDVSPSSQVLIWTKWTDPSAERGEEMRRKVRALRSGATDWITKGDGIEVLIQRVHEAVRRGPMSRARAAPPSPIEASIDDLIGHPPDGSGPDVTSMDDTLTPAERRAAAAAALGLERGKTIEQIAKSLKITIQTLRTHLRSIYSKWDVHGQAHFVAEARRRGLV